MATTHAASPRRAQLLTIAERLFAQRGYAQTTVRDIADEAGILSGSLYHHFSSKEEMLAEILQAFVTGLHERSTAIVEADDDPAVVLDGLIRSAFETVQRFPHAVALYLNESSHLGSAPEFAFIASSAAANEKIWLKVLAAGRRTGQFRDDLDMKLVYRFISDTVWASGQWVRPASRLSHRTVADQYLALLHNGLLGS